MWCKCCEPEPQENLVDVLPREILQTPTPQKQDEQDALAAVIQGQSAVPTLEVKEEVAASTVAPVSTPKEDSPSNLFTVTLDSQGDLGIVLDDLGSRGLVIAAMNAGSARDHGQLQQYDCIVSVNGVNGDVNRMWDLLESPGKCTLTVLRPNEMAFKLKKSDDEPLGIHMNFKSYSAGIVLEEIKKGGQFDRFLDSLPEASRALPGDRFVAINGTHLKGAELVEALKREANLDIIGLRY
ncbi:unnamed protein product [Symbiodinium sp. CCMP2456]|nr:unnamed protein product [Symbiodinium sp. CCMP2456]